MPNLTASASLRRASTIAAAAAGTALLASCGSAGSAAPAPSAATPSAQAPAPSASGVAASQAPVPAESNPPGDIPDTTVYVTYQSAVMHLQLKVPEGWARQQAATSATFASNLNSISIASVPMPTAPTVSTARTVTIPQLTKASRAFRLQSVQQVKLAGGQAVEIIYQVNSQPNPVTGRQYRLVVERFELQRAGRGALLLLSSAVGSDNVDPWRIVSESFRWL